MHSSTSSRRQLLKQLALAGSAAAVGAGSTPVSAANGSPSGATEFVLCFNTGTIRGQKLGLLKEIEITAQCGYQAIEPWVEHIEQYARAGGSLPDLRKRIHDLGLTVESAIGFPEWIVDDDARRAKGLERAKYEMDLVAQIGGKRLAAPPSGATDLPLLNLDRAAERYRALLEAGTAIGVVPQMEVWGFSRNVRTLADAAYIAVASGHPNACVLADVFHLYKGGSDFNGLRLLSGAALQVFHMNDFPANPPRDQVNDGFRVFPGDGAAPFPQIMRDLRATGGRKVLSLELFSAKYWEQDALEVAKAGYAKLKAAAVA